MDVGMDRDTVESFAAHLVGPGTLDLVTAPNVPDTEPGRLRLPDRPAGVDFFTWAASPGTPAGTGSDTTTAPGSAPPAC